MRAFSADLMELLAAKLPCYRADLFRIGPLLNGGWIYATGGDGDIQFEGQTYSPVDYGNWSRDSIQIKAGLESNSTRLMVSMDSNWPPSFPGVQDAATVLDGIKYGLLGAAGVRIYTAYMPVYGQVTGPTGGSLVGLKFVGEVAGVETVGQTSATLTVQDLLYRLNIQVPNRIIQPGCSWVLYSVGCGLNAADFDRTGLVQQTLSTNLFTIASITPRSSAGTFSQGSIVWTSGPNNGLTSYIRSWTAGTPDQVLLDVAPVFPVQAGHAFTVYEGCDHTFASCANLQGPTQSYINYGGQPTVPVPETAI